MPDHTPDTVHHTDTPGTLAALDAALDRDGEVTIRQRFTLWWLVFVAITVVLAVRLAGIAMRAVVPVSEMLVITGAWIVLLIAFATWWRGLFRRKVIRVDRDGLTLGNDRRMRWRDVHDVRTTRLLGRKRVGLVLRGGASGGGRLDPRGRLVVLPDFLPVSPDNLARWLAQFPPPVAQQRTPPSRRWGQAAKGLLARSRSGFGRRSG